MKHSLNETFPKLMSKNKNSIILETLKHLKTNYQTYAKMKLLEADLIDPMKSMKNNKTPGNEGLTKKL